MKTALFHLKFMLEARMPPGDPQETPRGPPESPREPQRPCKNLVWGLALESYYIIILIFYYIILYLYYIILFFSASSVHRSQTWGHAKRERGRGEGEGEKRAIAAQTDGQTRRFQMPKNMPIKEGLQKNVLLKQVLKSLWVIQGSVKG